MIVLGNHDYMGIPDAQIEFTNSSKNPGGLWHLPSAFYKLGFNRSNFSVDLFGIDTNGKYSNRYILSHIGCQSHVVRDYPQTIELLHEEKVWLREQLSSSSADWKIVFGHHPMYTRGKGHRDPCLCLRDEVYQYMRYHRTRNEETPETARGFGFEDVLVNGGVDLYVSGHEHVFQHHCSSEILHVVCGNSGADMRRGYGFYGGENKDQDIDWFDRSNSPGFVEFRVQDNLLVVNFITYEGNVFHSVRKSKK